VEIRQITAATEEQNKGSMKIIDAVNMVTNQAAQVTQATKEQAASVENIVRGVANARSR